MLVNKFKMHMLAIEYHTPLYNIPVFEWRDDQLAWANTMIIVKGNLEKSRVKK